MEGVPCLSPGQKHKTVIVLCVSAIFSLFFLSWIFLNSRLSWKSSQIPIGPVYMLIECQNVYLIRNELLFVS